MKYKKVYQKNTKDCGVACLLSIIKYYKGCNTFENIRYLTKCNDNGITALNLIEASKKLGFSFRLFLKHLFASAGSPKFLNTNP